MKRKGGLGLGIEIMSGQWTNREPAARLTYTQQRGQIEIEREDYPISEFKKFSPEENGK